MRLTFRHGASTALERLRSKSWRCATCDEEHQGMFHLSAFAPYPWQGSVDYEPNHALRMDGDFLSEDFCVIGGEHFFVRGVFDIPVHGLEEMFGFGSWSTLSRTNFDKYVDGFDHGDYADFGPWTGWFSDALQGFGDTFNQHCWVTPQSDRLRPKIALVDESHPLAIAQRNGISAERVLDIYASYGHAVG
jgi:hypothetical protein